MNDDDLTDIFILLNKIKQLEIENQKLKEELEKLKDKISKLS